MHFRVLCSLPGLPGCRVDYRETALTQSQSKFAVFVDLTPGDQAVPQIGTRRSIY